MCTRLLHIGNSDCKAIFARRSNRNDPKNGISKRQIGQKYDISEGKKNMQEIQGKDKVVKEKPQFLTIAK